MVLVTCVYAPYTLAFEEYLTVALISIDSLINIVFLCDVGVNFRSAFLDSDLNIVDNPKVIA